MKLYLVQHGEAKTSAEDPERPLTARGAAAVDQVAAWAGRSGLQVDEIRHSGKRRAEETAAVLALHLDPVGGTAAADGLKAKDDVEPVADELARRTGSLLLVGHLPSLDRLASRLLVGDAAASVVRFHNGGIVCLERSDDGWRLEWAVTDELLV